MYTHAYCCTLDYGISRYIRQALLVLLALLHIRFKHNTKRTTLLCVCTGKPFKVSLRSPDLIWLACAFQINLITLIIVHFSYVFNNFPETEDRATRTLFICRSAFENASTLGDGVKWTDRAVKVAAQRVRVRVRVPQTEFGSLRSSLRISSLNF